MGVPFLGISARYDISKMRNLRFEQPPKKSGRSWRGSHLAFDYGANTIAFGSNIEAGELAELKHQLEVATGAKIRRGDAPPGDTREKWEPDEVEASQETNESSPAHFTATVSPSRQHAALTDICQHTDADYRQPGSGYAAAFSWVGTWPMSWCSTGRKVR